jgi:Flp pilus assembly protein TadG
MANKITKRDTQHGVAAVELALLITLLLLIVAGVVEFGRSIWYYDALSKATRDSARYLSYAKESETVAINTSHINKAIDMVEFAANEANVPNFEDEYVMVTCDTDCDETPTHITVKVEYPILIGEWIPFFVTISPTSWNATLSPQTTMRYIH